MHIPTQNGKGSKILGSRVEYSSMSSLFQVYIGLDANSNVSRRQTINILILEIRDGGKGQKHSSFLLKTHIHHNDHNEPKKY